MEAILYPLYILGGMGLVFGLGLGLADKLLAVKTDPRIDAIKEALPGANCGGCGYAGCGAYAEAVVNEGAKTNGCPVGGDKVAAEVASVMGQDALAVTRLTAYVKCGGYCDKSKSRYNYNGIFDCKAATMLSGGGSKECQYGCIGLRSCEFACKFDAIRMVNDLAIIDPDKCTACGACISACPKSIIEFANYSSGVKVMCNSKDKGKDVKEKCEVGCIGCKICEKACKFDAVHVEDNLSKIDFEKCTNCGDCVIKCPTKSIAFSLRRITTPN